MWSSAFNVDLIPNHIFKDGHIFLAIPSNSRTYYLKFIVLRTGLIFVKDFQIMLEKLKSS